MADLPGGHVDGVVVPTSAAAKGVEWPGESLPGTDRTVREDAGVRPSVVSTQFKLQDLAAAEYQDGIEKVLRKHCAERYGDLNAQRFERLV